MTAFEKIKNSFIGGVLQVLSDKADDPVLIDHVAEYIIEIEDALYAPTTLEGIEDALRRRWAGERD